MRASHIGKHLTFLGRSLVVTAEFTLFGGARQVVCHYADDRGVIQEITFSLATFEQLFSGAIQ